MDFVFEFISLLNEKNHYLEKFYTVNETEYEHFFIGNFESIEYFYEARERLLKHIKFIDSNIERLNPKLQEQKEMSSSDKVEISKVLAIKDDLVKRIIAQDLEIMAVIEEAKSSIIKELQEVNKSKKAMGGYKTKSFNRRLDEEV